ncbi:MAG: OmpA family protein, partial [Tabrizicola sp.]|nr:OmpA family protein [Tabrizicola sp.]
LLRPADPGRAGLSPELERRQGAGRAAPFMIPLWTIALGTAGLVTAIYVGLGMQLSGRAEQTYTLARLIPPPERAEIFRPVRATDVQVPELLLEPVSFELLPEFQKNAPAETATALTGREDVSLAILNIQGANPEVFRSARADLNDVYGPLIASVAATIVENVELIGSVTVIGHTDSVPVQSSNPFASNQGLSEARAKTIAELLVASGVPAELVRHEGRAASDPVADNATKDGRAKNRRVEIKIGKKL